MSFLDQDVAVVGAHSLASREYGFYVRNYFPKLPSFNYEMRPLYVGILGISLLIGGVTHCTRN